MLIYYTERRYQFLYEVLKSRSPRPRFLHSPIGLIEVAVNKGETQIDEGPKVTV